MTGRSRALLLAVILLQAVAPGRALAHKVNLFAYQEDGLVFAEAYFADGTPCRNARIAAHGGGGEVVAEGLTDEKGAFSFPLVKSGPLRITLNAGDGHGSEVILEKEAGEDKAAPSGPRQGQGFESGRESAFDEETLRLAVEREIAPLRESVDRMRRKLDRPSPERIIGGLGWIVGIAGAYLWGAAGRKKNRE